VERDDTLDHLLGMLSQRSASLTTKKLEAPFIRVSPRFELDTRKRVVTEYSDSRDFVAAYKFSDKTLPVRIYRDRMTGWFFDVADRLLQERQNVAAVSIITPLVEALEEHIRGESSKNKSSEFFTASAKRIFGLTDEHALKLLYGGLRCGFAHHGFLKDDNEYYNILLTNGLSTPLFYQDRVLWVDAEKYVASVRNAYDNYWQDLSTNETVRNNFLKLWTKDWQMSLRVPGAGGTV
jgi:hypothetical protein